MEGERPTITFLTDRSLSHDEARELRFLSDAELIVEETECVDFPLAIEAAYLSRKSSPQAGSIAEAPEFLDHLLKYAFSENASDIHIEPNQDGVSIRVRIDGSLAIFETKQLSITIGEQLARRIKVLSKIEPFSLGVPVEGSFRFQFGESPLDIRVSCLPTACGEKIVLRLHGGERAGVPALEHLGLPSDSLRRLELALTGSSGMILVSGPTGSGKTTLLHSALKQIADPHLNICSLEDPVERIVPGITQSSIRRELGLDYANLLRFILRQDPDVIMIGEIRDKDTAETALTASLTGHLVLSTVHATDVFEIITRLRQFVTDDDLISKSLRLLISQRLVEKNCEYCSENYHLSKAESEFFRTAAIVRASRGCERCGQTGIKGRLVVVETLQVTKRIRELLSQRIDSTSLEEEAWKSGYLPLRFHVRERMLAGEISPGTALRVLGVRSER